MKAFTLKAVNSKHVAQQLMVAALFVSAQPQANTSTLDIGIGFGSDDNIFYTNTNEERETFGLLDLDFEHERALSETLELNIDAVYEGRHFNDESSANDRFFSGFTELAYKPGDFEFGVQLDPQYRQFVTSETDGILVTGEKQRIETLKARAYSSIDITEHSSIELGYEYKTKNYRDSDSDYDADTVDVRLRTRVSDSVRVTIGAEREQRDYDERPAVTATGADADGETLEIDRTVYFIRGTWRPAKNQKYSLEYKRRDNEDDFEDYFRHEKDQVTLRSRYEWRSGVALETKLKLSDKSYDVQLDDEGDLLDRDKSDVDVELFVPLELWLGDNHDGWYARVAYEWDDNDSGRDSRAYEKNTYWFAVHKVFD